MLRALLDRALGKARDHRKVAALTRQLRDAGRLGDLVGGSKPMQDIMRLVEQAAPSPASVLITGETGTGKEIVARTLHQLSPRSGRPFVAINCSAIPETLMESEIFGHEKGAFTGAAERRIGCFELADGGTLLLDEIGEMPPPTQAKLLRVLEDHKVRRLGSKVETPVDVRVLAATNKDSRAGGGRRPFAPGLVLPAQRFPYSPAAAARSQTGFAAAGRAHPARPERQAQPPCARPAARGGSSCSRATPGRAIFASCATCSSAPSSFATATSSAAPICRKILGAGRAAGSSDLSSLRFPPGATVDAVERELILQTLAVTSNKTRAAELLGISLKTLHNKLKEYEAAKNDGG